ncbi:hypothetical protein BH09PAT1_BH09PAT1_2000 [soil metagenome]
MFNIQKNDLLISFYIGCIAISELMGAKSFPLFTLGSLHLSASVAIFVVPLIYSINDVIIEVHGKARAQSVVRSGLLVILFFLLFSLLATHLPTTPRFSGSEKAYETIFSVSARISAASLIAFTVAEFLDVFIFARLRLKFGKKALWLRTNVSNIISQFFDTSLFMVLAFYALNKPFGDNFGFLVGLIIPYWLLKCAMSLIETPLVYLGVTWLKGKKA